MNHPFWSFMAIMGVAVWSVIAFYGFCLAAGWIVRILGSMSASLSAVRHADKHYGEVQRLHAQVAMLTQALENMAVAAEQGDNGHHQDEDPEPVANPQSSISKLAVAQVQKRHCPDCGTLARYVEWSEKEGRPAGHAYHCDPCNKWLQREKKGGD